MDGEEDEDVSQQDSQLESGEDDSDLIEEESGEDDSMSERGEEEYVKNIQQDQTKSDLGRMLLNSLKEKEQKRQEEEDEIKKGKEQQEFQEQKNSPFLPTDDKTKGKDKKDDKGKALAKKAEQTQQEIMQEKAQQQAQLVSNVAANFAQMLQNLTNNIASQVGNTLKEEFSKQRQFMRVFQQKQIDLDKRRYYQLNAKANLIKVQEQQQPDNQKHNLTKKQNYNLNQNQNQNSSGYFENNQSDKSFNSQFKKKKQSEDDDFLRESYVPPEIPFKQAKLYNPKEINFDKKVQQNQAQNQKTLKGFFEREGNNDRFYEKNNQEVLSEEDNPFKSDSKEKQSEQKQDPSQYKKRIEKAQQLIQNNTKNTYNINPTILNKQENLRADDNESDMYKDSFEQNSFDFQKVEKQKQYSLLEQEIDQIINQDNSIEISQKIQSKSSINTPVSKKNTNSQNKQTLIQNKPEIPKKKTESDEEQYDFDPDFLEVEEYI